MIRFRLPLFSILLLGWFTSMGLGLATAKAPTKAKKKEDPRILVAGVNVAARQVTFSYKRTGQKEVYKIDALTKVTVDHAPASLKDIRVDQEVFTYAERDSHTLDSIDVGAAEKAP